MPAVMCRVLRSQDWSLASDEHADPRQNLGIRQEMGCRSGCELYESPGLWAISCDIQAGSLSDLGDRYEVGGKSRHYFRTFDPISGPVQRECSKIWTDFPPPQ